MYLPVGVRVPSAGRTAGRPRQRQLLDGAARRLDRLDRGRREAVGPHRQRLRQFTPGQHLDQAPLGDQAPRRAGCPGVTSAPASKPSSVDRLTTWYSIRNGLLKPLAFGVRRCSGVWPPSNRAGTVPRAPWPLQPRPAVLPPLPPMPRPTPLLRAWRRPGRRLQVVDLHRQLPPPSRGAAPARSCRGPRAGRATCCVEPILPSPSARNVPRCFGLMPICDVRA